MSKNNHTKSSNKNINNAKIIIDYLATDSHNRISASIFSELTKTSSRTTFFNAIKYLESLGYIFNKETDNKTVYYSLSNLHELSPYNILTTDDYYKFLLLRIIQSSAQGVLFEKRCKDFNKSSYDYLLDTLSLWDESKFCYFNTNTNSIPVNIHKSKIRLLLNELIDGELIYCSIDNHLGNIYKSNTHFAKDLTKKDLLTTLFIANQIPSSHQYYKPLQSAKDKILKELFHSIDNVEDTKDNYILYGKEFQSIDTIYEDYGLLDGSNYKSNIIKVNLIDNGITIQRYFAIGLIVYSEESQQLYLLGRAKVSYEDEGIFSCLPLGDIQNISSTNYQNHEYGKAIYDEYYNSMINICLPDTHHVVVEFYADYLPTLTKLKRLHTTRCNSSLKEKHKNINGKLTTSSIVFEDEVSDLESLASYLRSFGRACKIIEPKELATTFKEEIEECLLAYKQEGFDV